MINPRTCLYKYHLAQNTVSLLSLALFLTIYEYVYCRVAEPRHIDNTPVRLFWKEGLCINVDAATVSVPNSNSWLILQYSRYCNTKFHF
jgi:hypothetical protein